MIQDISSAKTQQTKRKIPLREACLLATYHLRMLNWWLFVLMLIGFLGAGALFWQTVHTGTPVAIGRGNELSRFVLESGAGLIAGTLSSFLIVNDPLLEVQMVTHAGITKILAWRYLLTFLILLLCSAGYLAWSLSLGAVYTTPQTPLFLLLLWLAPVLAMSMLALLFALLTRSAPLGAVLAALPLIADLLLHDEMLPLAGFRPLFIPFSLWEYASPDWWQNRIALTVLGLLLAIVCWLRLRREEHLLGS